MPYPIYSATGHGFGKPRRQAADPAGTDYSGNQAFQPLPAPVGAYPFHLDLASVLGAAPVAAVQAAGSISFHLMGDVGGVTTPVPQTDVAQALEQDLSSGHASVPSFLYLLGDCVYYNGQPSMYYAQFYEPYMHYNAPILSVPGNHDGDPIDSSQSTLDGFLAAFCTPTPQNNPSSKDSGRTSMTQPNVYWTLDAPFVTIVGLYTNVPEHGRLDDSQTAWLHSELSSAPRDKALVLTMHHPPISADSHHGGSEYMFGAVDQAVAASGRSPDAVLAGHVHNYQRFSRTVQVGGSPVDVPYIVAGAGGYPNLHTMASDAAAAKLPWQMPNFPGAILEAFDDTHFGYGRMTVTATELSFDYVTVVPRAQVTTATISPIVVDQFHWPIWRR